MVVDRNPAAKPLISEMIVAKAFEFPGAADASQGGEDPKRDEQPRIGGVSAGTTLDRLDVVEPGVEIESADKAPDDACLGIGVEAFLERLPVHFDLVAVRDAKPGDAPSLRASGLLGCGSGKVVGIEGEGVQESLALGGRYETGEHRCLEL